MRSAKLWNGQNYTMPKIIQGAAQSASSSFWSLFDIGPWFLSEGSSWPSAPFRRWSHSDCSFRFCLLVTFYLLPVMYYLFVLNSHPCSAEAKPNHPVTASVLQNLDSWIAGQLDSSPKIQSSLMRSHKPDIQCQYTRYECGKTLTRSKIQDVERRELREFLPQVERVREQREHGLQRAEGRQRLFWRDIGLWGEPGGGAQSYPLRLQPLL